MYAKKAPGSPKRGFFGIALGILNDEGRPEYEKINAPAFSKIVKQKKYREDLWK